jgi:hypothetical protein
MTIPKDNIEIMKDWPNRRVVEHFEMLARVNHQCELNMCADHQQININLAEVREEILKRMHQPDVVKLQVTE